MQTTGIRTVLPWFVEQAVARFLNFMFLMPHSIGSEVGERSQFWDLVQGEHQEGKRQVSDFSKT